MRHAGRTGGGGADRPRDEMQPGTRRAYALYLRLTSDESFAAR